MQQSYFRDTQGCVAVYDITNRQSFNNIEEYIRDYFHYIDDDVDDSVVNLPKNVSRTDEQLIKKSSRTFM